MRFSAIAATRSVRGAGTEPDGMCTSESISDLGGEQPLGGMPGWPPRPRWKYLATRQDAAA